jgi:hypothetical protein
MVVRYLMYNFEKNLYANAGSMYITSLKNEKGAR